MSSKQASASFKNVLSKLAKSFRERFRRPTTSSFVEMMEKQSFDPSQVSVRSSRPLLEELPSVSGLSIDDLRKMAEARPTGSFGGEVPARAREELLRLYEQQTPRSPYAMSPLPQQPQFQQPQPQFQQPQPQFQQPQFQQPFFNAPQPGFSFAPQPDFSRPFGFQQGGSVSKRELDSLPGYRAGGGVGFSPVSRALPSERKFIDERLGEYEAYNREVEPYNQALEDYKKRFGEYQSAYDRYVADVEAYNRAADVYNAGDRYEDFTMAQPSFGMQAPEFTKQAPVMPNFTPEQLQQYQQQARQRAAQRASGLGSAFDMGIAPEVAQYFRKGIA